MKISQAEMDSRKRIAKVRSLLTDVFSKIEEDQQMAEDITYAEILMALVETQKYWLTCTWKEEITRGEG